MTRPNLPVILIDDLRFDEFGAGGHPYMQTPTWTAGPHPRDRGCSRPSGTEDDPSRARGPRPSGGVREPAQA